LVWGGEVKTLTGAEPPSVRKLLRQETLFCGYYINELILRFLHRADPHEYVFDTYAWTLDSLAEDSDLERTLRIFEKRLLQDVGYGLHLAKESQSGEDIQASQMYRYLLETGPVTVAVKENNGIQVHGESLQVLESEGCFTTLHRRELKQLTRAILDLHLEGKILHSRLLYSRLFPAKHVEAKVT
jgi:DNA repair protein RecO (recombination protein O)